MNNGFKISLTYKGKLDSDHKQAFLDAAKRWEEIITGTDSGVGIEVSIEAIGKKIDGSGGVLGRAGPRQLRLTDGLPLTGIMEFDLADLDKLKSAGTLDSVILHEMAHVLGIGTLWGSDRMKLLAGEGTDNPEYTGKNAAREYAKLLGNGSSSTNIPVANTGGPGTREGHWRESKFDYELMTGFAEEAGEMPISRMTIAAFEDLGYTVDYDKADAYELPKLQAAMTGLAGGKKVMHYCKVAFPTDVRAEGFEKKAETSCCCCVQ